MADVRVIPESFTLVKFDIDRIKELASTLAAQVGLPADSVIEIAINERTPEMAATVESIDPIRLAIEGGALEEPTVPRTLSDRLSADVIGRLLLRVTDRRGPGFAETPADSELDLPHQTAWDTYSVGRLHRLGYDIQKQRRLYHFRNRHGFSDVADVVFERLWTAEGLSWADIEAACEETASSKAGV